MMGNWEKRLQAMLEEIQDMQREDPKRARDVDLTLAEEYLDWCNDRCSTLGY